MEHIDLLAGGYALAANDDSLGARDNLIKAGDGWQTRRRREKGHDWCVLRLGISGLIRSVDVDTTGFSGNHPEECSLEATVGPHNARAEQLEGWMELVPRSPLQGDSSNLFEVDNPHRFTHLRLNIFPDGGVARLRVQGEPLPTWMRPAPLALPLDLAALENGGGVESCSDTSFGDGQNLILAGPQGWATRRRRDDGHDWAVVQLATAGTVHSVEIETSDDCPGWCSLEGRRDDEWLELLPRMQMLPHTVHTFTDEVRPVEGITQARLNIFPHGGATRLRLWGQPTAEGWRQVRLRWLNALVPQNRARELLSCCSSRRWADQVAAAAPFSTVEQLQQVAARAWEGLSEEDYLQAFAGHPRIGQKKTQTDRSGRWSGQEQARAQEASSQIKQELAAANQEYDDKFGFVFLICATGKSSEEILGSLRRRLSNDRSTEIKSAAAEQAKITELRLEKLLTI